MRLGRGAPAAGRPCPAARRAPPPRPSTRSFWWSDLGAWRVVAEPATTARETRAVPIQLHRPSLGASASWITAGLCRVAIGHVGAALLACTALAGAPALDASKLPPPAAKQIDFVRDIKPILTGTCLRCHGPERPKSHFRLTDRAAALKGGDEGVDIIPGQSAKSPLVYYTARLIPDMEMPPAGKGTPLTPEQVGLLRAWIDQGVVWEGAAESASRAALVPLIGWTSVHGNRAKFRELEGRPEGWNGGAENFAWQQQWPDGRRVAVEGHALRDDYKVTLDLRKPDTGFARFGFEQFRRYYDDGGGYYDFGSPTPSFYRLGEDLHMDIGRAWLEAGLTLPQWPRIVAGYEYQFKEGAKSMLTWGAVLPPSGDYRNIYPAAKQIDEHTHVLRLDVSYDIHGYRLEDNLRAEWYDSRTRRTDTLYLGTDAAALTQVRENHSYTHVANNVSVQKGLTDWWLASAGYRYSWLDGSGALQLTPRDASGQPVAGNAWQSENILLNEVWQVANASSQFRPLPHLTTTLALQGQWRNQNNFGDVNLDELDPSDPTSGHYPATVLSTLDQTTAEESFLVRYAGLPFTSLYGEVKLKEEDYNRFAEQQGRPLPAPHDFALDADARVRWQDYRIGFNSSPWTRVSFGGYYRHRDRDTRYDYQPSPPHDGAYPGFILARDIAADEIDARLTVKPLAWVKTTLSYQWTDSQYRTTTGATSFDQAGPDATPGGFVYAGHYQAHSVNAAATLTPFRRVYFSAALTYQNSRTTTANNDSPSVAPYQGDLWGVMASATWVLDKKTDLTASYLFSWARYGQHNEESGLPLGLDYDRHGLQVGLVHRFTPSVTGRLQYGYFAYTEPSSGHFRDYTAHQVLAVLDLRWR